MSRPRIAVASVIQETNTFASQPSTLDDFASQGLWLGEEADRLSRGSNSEIAGALRRLAESDAIGIPLIRAWAMSGGVLQAAALDELERLLGAELQGVGEVDGFVLCLHGALVAEHDPSADARLAELVREAIGDDVPLIVTHDLHANVTERIIGVVDALIGYHTYPHVDQGQTGARAASLALQAAAGVPLRTTLAKRRMLVPAEGQALADEPMRGLRALADERTTGPILDVSMFPVQPWLDVPELGFAVTVTCAADRPEASVAAGDAAGEVAEEVADAAWRAKEAFQVDLVDLDTAVSRVASLGSSRLILVHSADSPTAGAAADDASVIAALHQARLGVPAIATVVDPPSVDACWQAGPGAEVQLTIGASIDPRWSQPASLAGTVLRTGDTPVVLAGEAMTGQAISLGRWATVDDGQGLRVLVTERPAPTFDPQAFRHVGLDPEQARVIVVRSATLYRAGFAGLYDMAMVLDLPGASTPSFRRLPFSQAPRPMFPLDDVGAGDPSGQGE